LKFEFAMRALKKVEPTAVASTRLAPCSSARSNMTPFMLSFERSAPSSSHPRMSIPVMSMRARFATSMQSLRWLLCVCRVRPFII